MIQQLLLYGDLIVAGGILAWVGWRWWGKQDVRTLKLWGWGVCLGALWEFPLYWAGPAFSATPPYRLLASFPVAGWLQPVSHSIWDGGLLLIGAWLAQRYTATDIWTNVKGRALWIMVGWGVGSALIIEVIGSMGIWEYIPSWWNPELFLFQGKSITALAPMTWAIAPVVFYVGGVWGLTWTK